MSSSERIIYLDFRPNDFIKTTNTTLYLLPYFRNILDKHPDIERMFIDKDKVVMHHILELCRNGHFYKAAPYWIKKDLKYFQNENSELIAEDKIIKICVSGDIFMTTKETIGCMGGIFKARLDGWKMEDEIFLDRSPIGFQHVLSYLRNSDYPYPKEFGYELKFYGILNSEEYKEGFQLEPFKSLTNPKDTNPKYTDPNDTGARYIASLLTDIYNLSPDQLKSTIPHHNNPIINMNNHYGKNCSKSIRKLIEIYPDSEVNWGKHITFSFPRKGDLLNKLFLQFYIENLDELDTKNVEGLVFKLVKRIRILVGDNMIDSFDQDLLLIWIKLYHQKEYNIFIEKFGKKYLILPIHFFFHDQLEISYRMMLVDNKDIKLEVNLENFCEILEEESKQSLDINRYNLKCRLLANYILLDTYGKECAMKNFECGMWYIQHSQYYEDKFENINENTFNLYLDKSAIVSQIIFVIIPETIYVNDVNKTSKIEKFNYQDVLEDATLFFNDEAYCHTNHLESILDRNICGIDEPDIPIYTITFGAMDCDRKHSHVINAISCDGIELILNLRLKMKSGVTSGIVKCWVPNYNYLCYENGSVYNLFSNG